MKDHKEQREYESNQSSTETEKKVSCLTKTFIKPSPPVRGKMSVEASSKRWKKNKPRDLMRVRSK